MPEMNMSRASIGNTSWNPISSIANKLGQRTEGRANAMGEAIKQSQDLEHQKWTTLATHVLSEDAKASEHGRNTHFFEAVNKHAEGGTGVKMGFGDTNLEYTRKAKKVKAPVASKPRGPQLVGMPINIATAGKPAAPASPAVSAKQQKFAHRDLVTNKISHYEDKPQVLPTKKATAKKAAPKKKK